MGEKRIEKKHTRFQALNVNITNKEVTDGTGTVKINLELDLLNGTSKVFNSFSGEQIKSNQLVMGYLGENKWKHTFQINSDTEDDTYDIAKKLERYKHIIAIDTNTKLIESKIFSQPTKVSLGAAVAFIEEEKTLSFFAQNSLRKILSCNQIPRKKILLSRSSRFRLDLPLRYVFLANASEK